MKMPKFIDMNKLHGTFQGFGMKLTESRPEILMISGLISMAVATVMACRKTEDAKNVVSKAKENVKKVDETLKLPDPESGIEVLPETIKQIKVERGRHYAKIYAHLAYELVKIYGVSALLWFGGSGMIVGAHGELRKIEKSLISQVFAGTKALTDYRSRVAKAVGKEVEEKIFMGAQEGTVNVVEEDPETHEKKMVQKKADEFYAQPGSIFARNFTPSTTDLMYRNFGSDYDEYLNSRVNKINLDLETGYLRAMTGIDILRRLGYDETSLGQGEELEALMTNGISGNARLVPDPEMRRLKITKLRGYEKKWDVAKNMEVWEPCVRLDFNFYPLKGLI
jgi:hypothetical protein